MNHAIAAASYRATVEAAIAVFLIAIITAFKPWFALDQITPMNTVTATSLSTSSGAAVVIFQIAIITHFKAHLVQFEILANHAVATGCRNTIVTARICV
jgi:hypothetical protein